jgi:MtN3 and saliva related transmembrane protein
MWYAVGAVAALLTTFGFVPQIIKMRQTRSVKDVSLVTLLQFCLGVCIWAVYGVYQRDIVIIAANSISFVILVFAIISYFYYRRLDG